MSDSWTVAWKEWRELLRIGGGRRGVIVRALFSVGLLGVLWPWLIGAPFVASGMPVLFATMTAAMYVSALLPDSFPGERERHTMETMLASRLPDSAVLLGKIGAMVSYAFAAALLMLVSGWITVNLKVSGDLLLYDTDVLITAVVFSFLTAGLVGAFGTLVSLRAATVKQAQQVLTSGLMLLLLAPAVIAEAWPALWEQMVAAFSTGASSDRQQLVTIAAAMVLAQVILYAIAKRRFVREKLVSDER
ncbi:MAG: ABC transporter permease [Gemmatimonadota bacterium]